MNRRITILGISLAAAAAALAGTFYDRTYFAGDVGPYAWTAPASFSAAPADGGAYTNGASTNYYRIAGTNTAGRTPLASATGIIAGAASESNAYALTWSRRDGVTGYWIERSTDAATWTQHIALAVGATNYCDASNELWTAGAASPTGAIPSASGYIPLSWITNAGAAASYAVSEHGGLTRMFTHETEGPPAFAIFEDMFGVTMRGVTSVITNGMLGTAATNPASAFVASTNGAGTNLTVSIARLFSLTTNLISGTDYLGRRVAAPAATNSAGNAGDWGCDTNHVYIYCPDNLWRRAPISLW